MSRPRASTTSRHLKAQSCCGRFERRSASFRPTASTWFCLDTCRGVGPTWTMPCLARPSPRFSAVTRPKSHGSSGREQVPRRSLRAEEESTVVSPQCFGCACCTWAVTGLFELTSYIRILWPSSHYRRAWVRRSGPLWRAGRLRMKSVEVASVTEVLPEQRPDRGQPFVAEHPRFLCRILRSAGLRARRSTHGPSGGVKSSVRPPRRPEGRRGRLGAWPR